MSFSAVADTHAALWYLVDDPRLSRSANAFLDSARSERRKIVISSISLVEVVFLIDKGRIPIMAYRDLVAALADPEHIFEEVAVSLAVADAMRFVSRSEVPDMPDRIVAATAVHLDVPILSRDRRIQSANLTTLW